MIVAAAIKHNGIIFTGDRHSTIIKYMVDGLKIDPPIKAVQGFITGRNIFLNRLDSMEHAKICKQISIEESGVLVSEDLW